MKQDDDSSVVEGSSEAFSCDSVFICSLLIIIMMCYMKIYYFCDSQMIDLTCFLSKASNYEPMIVRIEMERRREENRRSTSERIFLKRVSFLLFLSFTPDLCLGSRGGCHRHRPAR